jgi:hypothetical protein
MKIVGRLIQVIQGTEYNGKNGKSFKGGFVIETQEQFPKKIHFDLWGQDKCNAVAVVPKNTLVEVSFDLESREYNGKWYTNARCYNFDYANQQQVLPQQPNYPQQMPTQPQMQQQPQGTFNTPPTQEDKVSPF